MDRETAEKEHLLQELRLQHAELEIENRDLKETRRHLEYALDRYQSLFRQAPIGFITHDDHGRIQDINEAAAALLKTDKHLAVGVLLEAFVDPVELEAYRAFLKRCLNGSRRDAEFKIATGSASVPVHFYTSAAPAVGDGIPLHTALIDLSDRKRREEELLRFKEAAETANEAKSLFLCNVNHEIRTPLAGMLGMIEITLDSSLDPEVRENLEIARSSGQALVGIVNDLLDFTRLESGKVRLHPAPFDLRRAIRETIKLVAPEAARKNLRLTHQVANEVPPLLYGDAARISQVILNLMGNAVKFSESGVVALTVTCSSDAGTTNLHLKVSDTGIGIAEEKQREIFGSFKQVDPSHTRSRGGTGLGLAITSRLLELMQGKIEVQSALGAGTVFGVTIPLGTPPAEKMTEQQAQAPQAAGKACILLAEDDSQIRKLMTEFFTRDGHVVISAANGKEALQLWEGRRPDVILMDIQMPKMDGLEATRQIREREKTRGEKVPIYGLTAHVMEEEVKRCLAAGMTGHLPKPVDLGEVRQLLRNLRPTPS